MHTSFDKLCWRSKQMADRLCTQVLINYAEDAAKCPIDCALSIIKLTKDSANWRVNILTMLTFCLLVSSAGNICKQFGSRSGLTKCQAWSGSILFDTLMVFQIFSSKNLRSVKEDSQILDFWRSKCLLKSYLTYLAEEEATLYLKCLQ